MKLYLDIETVTDDKDWIIDEVKENTKPPGNISKQETIDKWYSEKFESAYQENLAKCALKGEKGRICSIAWAVDNNDIRALTIGVDGVRGEREVLTGFLADMNNNYRSQSIIPIGHNVIGFDLSMIRKRAIINRIPLGMFQTEYKPWDKDVFDTMLRWDAKEWVSQSLLAKALGLPTREENGSMVGEWFKMEKYQDIQNYNKADVEENREIAKIMMDVLNA